MSQRLAHSGYQPHEDELRRAGIPWTALTAADDDDSIVVQYADVVNALADAERRSRPATRASKGGAFVSRAEISQLGELAGMFGRRAQRMEKDCVDVASAELSRFVKMLAERCEEATATHRDEVVPAPAGMESHYVPRCSICGKVATQQDIDGDWWPPCEHAKTHGLDTLRWERVPDSRRAPTDSAAPAADANWLCPACAANNGSYRTHCKACDRIRPQTAAAERPGPAFDLGKCQVCNDEPAVGVASSFLPMSFAYGRRCLQEGYEPYSACVARLLDCGITSRDDVDDGMGIRSTIDRSLAFHGKTWDELLADVAKADAEYEASQTDDGDDGRHQNGPITGTEF